MYPVIGRAYVLLFLFLSFTCMAASILNINLCISFLSGALFLTATSMLIWDFMEPSVLKQTWSLQYLALALMILSAVLIVWQAIGSKSKIKWHEEIVVITGGASGMGFVIAETLASRNAKVVVLDINLMKTNQASIRFYKCDVSNPAEVDYTGSQIVKDVGHPTILINNAGVVNGKTIIDLTTPEIQNCLNTNLFAQFLTIKQFLPNMLKANRGHIVTVASAVGYSGCSQASDYCASKAALISLHESLHSELRSHYHACNIQTTLVCPGLVTTGMFDGVRFRFPFLTPILEPMDVTKKIVATLEAKKGRRICTPFYVKFMGLMRFLPESLIELIHVVLGVDDSMKTWTGRVGTKKTL